MLEEEAISKIALECQLAKKAVNFATKQTYGYIENLEIACNWTKLFDAPFGDLLSRTFYNRSQSVASLTLPP